MEGINLRALNIVCVCVDTAQSSEVGGRIYHRYTREAVEFHSIGGMLGIMGEFFDAIDYPQSATEPRSFRKRREEAPHCGGLRPEPLVAAEEFTGQRGEIVTFIIQVQYRQDASWQGSILWAEREAVQSFRSALELIKLMDSCVQNEKG